MRNIAVFTCNRADEGPMGPVVKALGERGLSFWRTDDDGWRGLYKNVHTPQAQKADVLLVLGDRHELLGVCHTALCQQIPIAHIHGGETTLGSFDDKVRNAVSQLADIHFTAADAFTERLVSMGIRRDRIWTVGPPGLDDMGTDERSEFGEGFFLVCLHPDTTRDARYNHEMARALIEALARFPQQKVYCTPNDDPGSDAIRAAFDMHPTARHDLPRRTYLTALKHAAVCIGNSSSFVIEAPALDRQAVIVGDRQKGRPFSMRHLQQAMPTADDIAWCIERAINGTAKDHIKAPLPYGHGGASQKIAEVLATWSL